MTASRKFVHFGHSELFFSSKMIFSKAASKSSCKCNVGLMLLVNPVFLFDGNSILFAFEDR